MLLLAMTTCSIRNCFVTCSMRFDVPRVCYGGNVDEFEKKGSRSNTNDCMGLRWVTGSSCIGTAHRGKRIFE